MRKVASILVFTSRKGIQASPPISRYIIDYTGVGMYHNHTMKKSRL